MSKWVVSLMDNQTVYPEYDKNSKDKPVSVELERFLFDNEAQAYQFYSGANGLVACYGSIGRHLSFPKEIK